jgi:hypothetical protein
LLFTIVKFCFPFFTKQIAKVFTFTPALSWTGRGWAQANQSLLCSKTFVGCYGVNKRTHPLLQRPYDLVSGTMHTPKLLENKN